MRIAVAYNNGEIYEHFGHCENFAIYDYFGAYVNEVTKTVIPTGDRHGHADMAQLMKDEKIDAVICGQMGGEAKAMLLSFGIVPIVGYSGSADDAADMLVTGQLPILGEDMGGCAGGCGGCGGCHSDGESGCGGCCH